MIRYTTTLVAAILFLGGSAWAQVFQIPPGHYYGNTHREICTHGLSTPETNYTYTNNNNCPPPGNRYGQQVRRDRRVVRQNNRQNRRIYQRYQNNNNNCR